jgi:uncharacterized protein YjbJ (UPF0337 family)
MAAFIVRAGHMPVRPDAAASAGANLCPNGGVGNTVVGMVIAAFLTRIVAALDHGTFLLSNRFVQHPTFNPRFAMDENRFAGTAKNIGGKVQEGVGRATGDTKTQAEGIANQAAGAMQDLYGQARDTASDAAGAARDSAASLEKWLRHTIETQPYTTALIAVGIGWILGRMHRPL